MSREATVKDARMASIPIKGAGGHRRRSRWLEARA